jgi:predicted transcriptional regulator
MNVNALIDAIVRQTTILVAQLATTGGGRAQLAHTANQVFLDLVAALKEQGVGSKVIADMFGLALRTYQEKVRRLSESHTLRGRSLWEAVLEHLEQHGPELRAEVLRRFSQDDPASVRGVLRDLVHSGLVFRTGRGDATAYRAAKPEELHIGARESRDLLSNLVWVSVQRLRPASVADVAQFLAADPSAVETALRDLEHRGLVRALEDTDTLRYESHGCVLPFDEPQGWEAAVYDHFQAMVTALCVKLRQGKTAARRDDTVGGSTFGFEVWPAHPHLDEVTGYLREMRQRGSALRQQVAEYNAHHDANPEDKIHVIAYVGQAVVNGDGFDQNGRDGEIE